MRCAGIVGGAMVLRDVEEVWMPGCGWFVDETRRKFNMFGVIDALPDMAQACI